jgi:DNA-binding transcriptional LysR family regulator
VDAARRQGLLIAGVAAAPFCLAQAAAAGPELVCPFRAATGLPCPLCGATRAFALAGRGDSAFLRFNGWWVLLAAVALGTGLGVAMAARPLHAPRARGAALAVVLLVFAVAAPWTWALAQRGTIVG